MSRSHNNGNKVDTVAADTLASGALTADDDPTGGITRGRRRQSRLPRLGLAALVTTIAGAAILAQGITIVHAATGSSEVHVLGALPPTKSAPVPRLAASAAYAAASLPSSVDLTPWHMPVANQGAISSCVEWAIDYGLLGWYSRHDARPGQPFAPMYTYSQLNGGRSDQGTFPGDALEIAKTQGNDTAADYAQGTTSVGTAQNRPWFDYVDKPTQAQTVNSANYKIVDYQNWTYANGEQGGVALDTWIQTELASSHPVAISLGRVRYGFNQLGLNAPDVDTDTSTTPATDSTGAIEGHEVLALGYDSRGILIQNSWGTTWGMQDQGDQLKGFGWLGWNVVEQDVNGVSVISGINFSTADTTPPSVTAPKQGPQLGATVSTGGVTPYLVTWTASDSSGIANTSLYYTVDGGAWNPATLRTTTSALYNLTPGHTYRFAVRAQDGAGNWSQWQYGPTLGVSNIAETHAAISYSGTWTTASWASAVGGQLKVTAQANARATFTFTGSSLGWIATKASNRGRAAVYFDGVYQGMWDLYSATTQARAVVLNWNSSTAGTHSLEIVAEGTTGRPNVDIDSFIIGG